MGLTVITLQPASAPHVVLDRKLWYTKGREGVVEDGDPRAASLLGSAGKKVPLPEAIRLGLVTPRGDGPAEGHKADEGADGGPDDAKLEDLTVEQLQHRLRERDLPVSGPKKVLIDRLVEDDQKKREPQHDKSRKPEGDK